MPAGRVLELIGALALVAAFYMPWFGNQGLLLSGQFLTQLLMSTTDLRQFVPTAAGGPLEVQLLRGLVLLFPVCGGLAVALTLIGVKRGFSRGLDLVLGLLGAIPLLALLLGMTQLPPGSTVEAGMWCMALGGLAILVGLGVDARLNRGIAT